MARLNNIGEPAVIMPGRAAQSPKIDSISISYIELLPSANTPFGGGEIVYKAPETTEGGSMAIDLEKSIYVKKPDYWNENADIFEIPLSQVQFGTYKYIRIVPNNVVGETKFYIDSLYTPYQIKGNFQIDFNTVLGSDTYIKSLPTSYRWLTVNANKKQGFVFVSGRPSVPEMRGNYSEETQIPENATTVVNPLYNTSPVPLSSGAITAAISPGWLTIRDLKVADIMIEVSLSVNKSFEWEDHIANGVWEPGKKEKIVDMGFRGMTAVIVKE